MFRRSSEFCVLVIQNDLFKMITILVVSLNCIDIILDNSVFTGGPNTTDPTLALMDNIFFIYYILEMFLKVFAMGFIFNEGAYLKDGWNGLDFFILSTAVANKIVANYGINLKGIRALRVLRPLKIIGNIKNLQKILESLFQAFPLLVDSFLILTFCYLLYALAGLQLFSGILAKRCIFLATGLPDSDDTLCGNLACESDQICSKLIHNPNSDIMNFDNIFYSFLNVFQIVTVDNWTSIMYSVQKTFTNYACIYFLSLVIIGGLFLVNLTLAIIKVKFSGMATQTPQKREKKIKKHSIDLLTAKHRGLWPTKKNSSSFTSFVFNKAVSIKNSENNLEKMDAKTRTSNNTLKMMGYFSIFALKFGKATRNLGKLLMGNKITKTVDKLTSVAFWKKKTEKIDSDYSRKNLENIEHKYLKIEVQFNKEFLSESTVDVLTIVKNQKLKSVKFVTVLKLSIKKSHRMKRFRGFGKLEYRLPKYAKDVFNMKNRAKNRNKLIGMHKGILEGVITDNKEDMEIFSPQESIHKIEEPLKRRTTSNLNLVEIGRIINEKIDEVSNELLKMENDLFNNEELYEKFKVF